MKQLLIIWSEDSSLGVPILDEHHRGIVSIMNSLFYYMSHPAASTMLIPHINMITEYGRIHFMLEEELMEQAGYPNIEEHKKTHNELTLKTNQIAMEARKTGDPYELLQFMKVWWMEHINVDDKAAGPYLRAYMQNELN